MKIILLFPILAFCFLTSPSVLASNSKCEKASYELVDDLTSMHEFAQILQGAIPNLVGALNQGEIAASARADLKNVLQTATKAIGKFSTIQSKPISKWNPPGPELKGNLVQNLKNHCNKTKLCPTVISEAESSIGIAWSTLLPLLSAFDIANSALSQGDKSILKKLASEISKGSGGNEIFLKQMKNNQERLSSDLKKECY